MLHPALSELPTDLSDLVERELTAGERVVWAQRPVYRFASAAVLAPMIFAVPWLAITCAVGGGGTYMTLAHGSGGAGRMVTMPFALVGLLFTGVGLLMLTSPIWVKRSTANTVYAITDQRALLVRRGVFGRITARSFSPELVASMERSERRDGSGDLVFESYRERRGSSTTTVRHGFMSVADVRGVEAILRTTLLAGRTRNV